MTFSVLSSSQESPSPSVFLLLLAVRALFRGPYSPDSCLSTKCIEIYKDNRKPLKYATCRTKPAEMANAMPLLAAPLCPLMRSARGCVTPVKQCSLCLTAVLSSAFVVNRNEVEAMKELLPADPWGTMILESALRHTP